MIVYSSSSWTGLGEGILLTDVPNGGIALGSESLQLLQAQTPLDMRDNFNQIRQANPPITG